MPCLDPGLDDPSLMRCGGVVRRFAPAFTVRFETLFRDGLSSALEMPFICRTDELLEDPACEGFVDQQFRVKLYAHHKARFLPEIESGQS